METVSDSLQVAHADRITLDDVVVHAPVFPHHTDLIPPGTVDAGAYQMRFAWSRADLEAVRRLRFRVFTEELGEGNAADAATGLDADPRDPWFHHLMICHRASGAVVGTYRLQTAVMAATRFGFYSASLFELGAIPAAVLGDAVEIGRACVDAAHRNGRVIRLLWKGVARYVQHTGRRFVFGCCSLQGTDRRVAIDAWKTVHARRMLHDRFLVRPHPEARALVDDGRLRPLIDATSLEAALPPLFESYLSLGARVCGAPAVDREFGTTDFLVMLDVQAMDQRAHGLLFAA